MFRQVWSGWLLSLVAAVAIGCSSNDSATPPAGAPPDAASTESPSADSATEAEDHHHGDAPHGGVIADWGGGAYHVEFTVDHEKQEATVYVLGSDAKSPAPVKADKLLLSINEPAFQVELAAQPLEGEAEGTSSRFVGRHENLGTVREFAGAITGEADGTPYAGEFDEAAHNHEH